MRYLTDSKTMKEVDTRAQEEIGIPGSVLMERAALAVAEAVQELIHLYGSRQKKEKNRILAVCGIGNNGGDGVAAARILYEWGYPAEFQIIGEERQGSALLKRQIQIAERCGVKRRENNKASASHGTELSEYTIVIDALFGIGLTRAVEGVYAECIHEMNLSGVPIVAVDMPSGVNADNGRIETVAVRAKRTVTFGYSKLGLELYPGREYAGTVQIADIGFPKQLEETTAFPAFQYEEVDVRLRPPRREYSNKGTFGKVMVVAGMKNMCGACYLSAKAAFRTGAGMVKILTVEENREALHTLLPEAILATYEPEHVKSKLEIERICQELTWADAVVVGPGLGRSAVARLLVDLVLQYAHVPVVVDADALHHIAANPEYVGKKAEGESFNRLYIEGDLVLTPHIKEMADLLSCEIEQIQADMPGVARSVIRHMTGRGLTLALKDARSVVACAGEMQLCVNASGNSGMATAGSGDVLTGIIAALLAQGMSCFEAASLGVYLHGLAGDKAAEKIGRYACMAEDILEGLTELEQNSR